MKLAGVIPVLRSFDEGKAREFYVDYLGFSVDFEHRFGDNMPLFLQVSRDDCVLRLSEHHGDGTPGTRISIATSDVDAYCKELVAKKYRYYNPQVVVTPWESRDMQLTDPFGSVLIFSEPKPEP